MRKLFPFILWVTSWLQAQHYPFTVINARNGLPQSSVFKIIQDPQGYIWFATEGGVARYDGYEFKNYATHDGIGAQFISDAEIGPDGSLWVSTLGKGIAWFDGIRFHNIGKPSGLPSNQIRNIEFFNDELWVASSDSGVIRVSHGSGARVLHFSDGRPLQSTWRLMQDRAGTIWAAGRDGITRFTPESNYQPQIVIPADRTMLSLFQDFDGSIWAGGVDHLFHIRSGKVEDVSDLLPAGCKTIWDLYRESADAPLFLATMGGICQISDTGVTVLTTLNGLPDNQLRHISKDRFGNLWMGTYGGGAMIYREHGMQHFDRSEDGYILPTFALTEDGKGRIWAGTDANGYFVFENGGFRKHPDPRLNQSLQPISAVKDNRNGDIWLAGMTGAIYIIRDSRIIRSWLPSEEQDMFVLRFCQMPDGGMLLATKTGAYILYDTMDKPARITELPEVYYRGVFSDDYGYFWFLGDEGEIFRFRDGKVDDFTPKLNPDRFNMDDGLYDRFHDVWWFCSNAGLIVYDGTRARILHSKNGLHSDSPWSVTQDSTGNIWIGHEKGVERIRVDDHRIDFYGVDQGFLPVETNSGAAMTDSRGDVWFGTISSATRIRISGVTPDKVDAEVRIQGVFDGQSALFEERYGDRMPEVLTLAHDQNDLVFRFAALSYRNPGDVRYTWYLAGQDFGWQPLTTRREAVYSNLPPGQYIFRVMAQDPDGHRTPEVAFSVEIRKPFWNRAWFYSLEVLFLGLIIYLSFRYSANPAQNKLGSVLTLVSILVVFESFNIVVSGYMDRFTGGIPVYQLVMNVILAASLQPLEQVIRKFMKRLARRKATLR